MVAFFLISLFLFQVAVGEKILGPKKKCVPTATIHGPFHECVCHTDGVYHCREEGIASNQTEFLDPNLAVCEPNQLYRQESTLCSCTNSGHWRSSNCREQFHRLLLKQDPIKKNIRTNITCNPNSLYITDCNICVCKANGVIDFDACTTRSCPKRHKGDLCKPSDDVYRSANEFCICSIVNYFVDRLCIKVNDDVVQNIPDSSIDKIIEGTRYTIINETKCTNDTVIYKDCNTCTCFGNIYICTSKVCYDNIAVLRSGKIKKASLPTLKSDRQKCVPGRKYRYKCNTCMCNRKGVPVCTSMICLQDIVMDAAVLRQNIVSY